MKTFLKIAALAAITALAVISCLPEVPDAHFDWWDQYKEQFDASENTLNPAVYSGNFTLTARSISAAGNSVSGALSIDTTTGGVTASADNYVEVTISDTAADIFKANNAEAKLKEFLSFYTYNPNEIAPEELGRGKAHTLTPYTGWALERKKNGTTFVLKLTAPFTAVSSHLVYKIDSTKYTYRNGLKMDRDGNGIPGEAFYDDLYGRLTVNDLTNSTEPQLPGTRDYSGATRGITVTLTYNPFTSLNLTAVGTTVDPSDDRPADFNFPTESDTVTKAGANVQIVTSGSINYTFLSAEDKDDILISLLSGIKIEEFTEAAGDWTPSNFYASFDESSKQALLANPGHRIIIKDFKPVHMTAYRVVFEKSSVSLETAKEYFGVKQRITVSLNGNITGNKTSVTRREGTPRLYFNPLIRGFKSFGDVNYIDNTGTSTTWYTYYYKWSPGYIKNKNAAPSEIPNPDYDAVKELAWAAVDQSYEPGKTPYTVNPAFNARKAVAASIRDPYYTDIGETTIQAVTTPDLSGFDLNKEWAADSSNYDSTYDTSTPMTVGDPAYDSAKESAWSYWNSIKGDYSPGKDPTIPGPDKYVDFSSYYPASIPDSLSITGVSTTSAAAPAAPLDPKLPDYGQTDTLESAWVWAGEKTPWITTPQVATPIPSLTTSTTVHGDETRANRFTLERSNDQNGQNVVLRLEIGPNSITKDGINTRYYAKQLDLKTFKKNFRIVYSKSNNSSATDIINNRNDVVEINIEKVEYKQEKIGSDKFDDSDPNVKYSGYNVIYVTLDPNYKYDLVTTSNNRYKYLFVGSGFAYDDGINVFSSQNIWANKGAAIYQRTDF